MTFKSGILGAASTITSRIFSNLAHVHHHGAVDADGKSFPATKNNTWYNIEDVYTYVFLKDQPV